MRVNRLGYILLEYPIKTYNLYNLRDDDYNLLVGLLHTSNNPFMDIIEMVEKLRPEIEKVGKEKTYLRCSVGYRYLNNLKKHTTPRKLFDKVGTVSLFDKTQLTNPSYNRRKVDICSDKELVKMFESKEFLYRLSPINRFMTDGTRPWYFLLVTLIMMHGNPYK